MKQFALSPDLKYAVILLANNRALVYKLLEEVGKDKWAFVSQEKLRINTHRLPRLDEKYQEVLGLFIYNNIEKPHKDDNKRREDKGQYSMYIACSNGILLFEGIDLN